MKLKRLFLDNFIKKTAVFFAAVFAFLFISCSSNKFAFPIPGENASAITNIYIEYLNIADIYFSLEKFDKAESYYKAAMGNKDIYWNAYYKLAKCYVYQSKWGDAQTAYETMLKRDPDYIHQLSCNNLDLMGVETYHHLYLYMLQNRTHLPLNILYKP